MLYILTYLGVLCQVMRGERQQKNARANLRAQAYCYALLLACITHNIHCTSLRMAYVSHFSIIHHAFGARAGRIPSCMPILSNPSACRRDRRACGRAPGVAPGIQKDTPFLYMQQLNRDSKSSTVLGTSYFLQLLAMCTFSDSIKKILAPAG